MTSFSARRIASPRGRRCLPGTARGALATAFAFTSVLGVLAVEARALEASAALVPPVRSAPDTVRGVVFDSLAGAPLAQAFVLAEPAGVSVPTDSLGRFTVVSDAPVQRLTVYHEALDEIGLGAIVLSRPTDGARWTDVTVATPSLATIWRTVCRADVPNDVNRGVLVGSVRLADDRTRVSGAGITAQWEAILPRTRLRQAEQRDTRSDSTGSYALCGVPAQGELVMAGSSVEYASGAVQVAMVERPLRRIDLVMAPANSRVDRWPTITGRVIGPDQQPVPNARVAVDGVDS
nr:hypothetical protein [Gemmatimonadaceae bacterium]